MSVLIFWRGSAKSAVTHASAWGCDLGDEDGFAAVRGVEVEGDPLAMGVDGGEGFTPSFESRGVLALVG